LAEALLEEEEIKAHELIPPKELNRLRGYLHGPPKTVADCADKIKTSFLKAIDKPTEHPLGPMFLVPPPLRVFVRDYVTTQAFRRTQALREREATSKLR
jgi:hypothetical protein